LGRLDLKKRLRRFKKRPAWVRVLAYTAGVLLLAGLGSVIYVYVSYGRLIDERLNGERERTLPRVYARPVELRVGQPLTVAELVARLNDLGFANRESADAPGEFTIRDGGIILRPRTGEQADSPVRIAFTASGSIRGIQVVDGGAVQTVRLGSPLLTALMTSAGRERRRVVALDTIPLHMQQAVLAIEDQSFYFHPGINPFRTAMAVFTNLFGDEGQVVGGSTVTQQLARMFFLADEFNAEMRSGTRGRTWESRLRKAREIVMSLVLERRASKDEILELYLNDVYLGQRGSFAIHGVAEASRVFFGKDVANLSLAEAAVIAGAIQNPSLRSPFANPQQSMERRNVVLAAMAGEEFVSPEVADRASKEPLQVVARAVDNAAPYFVDMVADEVAEAFPGITAQAGTVEVYTTLDMDLQRVALDAVRNGLTRVDELLARRRRPQRAQAALIAVDPRSGEILAMVGGRSYNVSQYNRAIVSRRQPGSTFKPFVFLAALDSAQELGRYDFSPASLTPDEPTTFTFDDQLWEPKNYEHPNYDGMITWRQALAMSRNLGTIHVAQEVGFDRVAAFWRKVGVGAPVAGYPSITLGVFEITPYELAEAYTLFTNGGSVRPLRAIDRIETEARTLRASPAELRSVASPQSAYLVTSMMRSVLNEGTGTSARANGFTDDAAGKSGTTNDQRDAWFVGFTPDLLTVVWVGFDDNQPVSLTGSQAALPIWTEFMRNATAGRDSPTFEPPEEGITWAEIDRDTGKLALPTCPRVYTEAFHSGSEPGEYCELHRW
jgi:penicillin-binding protein 1B